MPGPSMQRQAHSLPEPHGQRQLLPNAQAYSRRQRKHGRPRPEAAGHMQPRAIQAAAWAAHRCRRAADAPVVAWPPCCCCCSRSCSICSKPPPCSWPRPPCCCCCWCRRGGAAQVHPGTVAAQRRRHAQVLQRHGPAVAQPHGALHHLPRQQRGRQPGDRHLQPGHGGQHAKGDAAGGGPVGVDKHPAWRGRSWGWAQRQARAGRLECCAVEK